MLRAFGAALANGLYALIGPTATVFASRPAASANGGRIMRFTDVGPGQSGTGGGAFFFSNGTRWKPVEGYCTLDAIDTANTGVLNTAEQQLNPNHVAIPAGVIALDGDRFDIYIAASKSGSSDSSTIRVRFGTTGTTADPVIATITDLAGANQSYGSVLPFKRISSTSVQKQGNANPSNSLLGAGTGAYPAAVTVSDMGANAMFVSITAQMTGGTETTTIQDYVFALKATDNG